jgi:hypothetical protein
MTETRTCLRCNGSKVRVQEAFDYRLDRDASGAPLPDSRVQHYPRKVYTCMPCNGAGAFTTPDLDAILAAVKGRKGLCSKRPADTRAYYVWRMARFHGGADVTMPMSASMDVSGDPFRVELDAIADAVAKRVFGTDLAAAHRWGRVLGHIDRDMPGLPDSAYPGGRVADADKPIEEQSELL